MDEVLELYYHCKTCSEPQAYLEQAIFLEHVQDNHPEYIKQETEEEQKFVYVYSSDIKTEVICMYSVCFLLTSHVLVLYFELHCYDLFYVHSGFSQSRLAM